ncbi:hypothetical protein ACNARK_04110 [Proteus sp. DFP240708]|uniref:hypothetical protein n=1 Tax=Proteus sp. DFP240708 TaxID=3399624 RepID=UPI003A4D97AD
MEKKVVNIEYEIAAVKVVLKALLLTLTDKQKEIVIHDINKTINDAYIDHPQYQNIISKTEQYIKNTLNIKATFFIALSIIIYIREDLYLYL